MNEQLIFYEMKDILKTPKTDDFPEITWILGDVIHTSYKNRIVAREASGSDTEGNNYSAYAYFFKNEFEQMEKIRRL